MQNVLVTGPSVEPITPTEAKTFLRLTEDQDDTLVGDLITAARTFFETKTQLALINQTWKLTLDHIPSCGEEPWWDGVQEGSITQLSRPRNYIELPVAPLSSITSFKAYASDDTSTLFTDFYADTGRRPGRCSLRNGSVWPTGTRGVASYEIAYVAGFGAAGANVPGDIRLALRQIIAHWYENRELMSLDGGSNIPLGAQNIINSRRIRNL